MSPGVPLFACVYSDTRAVPTAEDVTSARRAERKVYKQQKAKERANEREKLAEAMLDKKVASPVASANGPANVDGPGVDPDDEQLRPATAEREKAKPVDRSIVTRTRDEAAPQSKPGQSKTSRRARDLAAATARQEQALADRGQEVQNLEYTQLQREEALFLLLATASLGILRSASDQPMTLREVWQAFLLASTAMPRAPEHTPSLRDIRPDNPFILSYVAYHHYRSLGWVVRNGIKFCVDWVLYKGADGTLNPRGGVGPVGGHAE